MWTVRGPWPYGPRPGQEDNITALEYLYSYGENPTASPKLTGLNPVQRAMLDRYKSFGYTHVAFGPINAQSYHGQYPDYDFTSQDGFEVFLDWLQVFWNEGLAPVVFLHGDGQSFSETYAMYDHLIRGNARAQRLMRIVVAPGWEPTRYDWSSVTWAKYGEWARELLPRALSLLHTVADVDAPVGTDALFDDNDPIQNPHGNGAGWGRVAPHYHGWLIQNGAYTTSPSQDPILARNFGAQFLADGAGAETHSPRWHFVGGINWWPQGSAWGPNTPLKLYNAECTSYEAYWHNLPYSSSIAWGDLAMSNGADGYLDSGTAPVGGSIPPPWVRS